METHSWQSQMWALLLLLGILTMPVTTTLSKGDRSSKQKEQVQTSDKTVLERGLVTETVKAKDILKEHQAYCDKEREKKAFPADVLAYVTPWNNHGYDVAKLFGPKFSYVSPVWLQIRRRPSGAFTIEGGHDIDKTWIKDVTKGRAVQMMPRVLFDGWTMADYNELFSSEDNTEDCIEAILSFVKDHGFHGITLEIWSQLGGRKKNELIHFLNHLGEAFDDSEKTFILVLPPPINKHNSPGMVTRQDFELLAPVVDGFSLMTYDYSNPMSPGPNSPLPWVRSCVEALVPQQSDPNRRKILLGLNFYGNDYVPGGGGPVVGGQYLQLLTKHKPKIRWDDTFMEHVLKYTAGSREHTAYFPTLKSIQARLQLANELNTGISIWEIGQGLDYFYDLL